MKKTFLKYLPYALLLAAAAFLIGYRLWLPAEQYFDEVHYVKFMRALLYDNVYLGHASQHPPFWHLLMTLAVELLGDQAFAWRIVSVIAHLGVLIFVFKIARKITNDPTIAWIAVFLLFFDCVSLTQARIAMMNSTMLVFVLAAIYYFLGAFQNKTSYDQNALRCAGVFWAFALASKMVSINVLLFFVPLLFIECKNRPMQRLAILKEAAVYFILVPLLLMLCVHVFVPFLKDRTIVDIWGIQAYNLSYHATTTQTHGYTSRWWTWPLLLRPISFYFHAENWNTPAATCETILAIGNPVLFWTIPVAVFFLAMEFFKKQSRVHGIVLLGFLAQWLTFALGSRMQFFHYIYQAMPFVVMAVALLLSEIRTWGRGGRIFVVVYLIAVAAMFVYWYPLLIGMTISREFFYQHMWFPRWI
jgi:dolichyl-phosphate-mannose-protein mannosyltransferase